MEILCGLKTTRRPASTNRTACRQFQATGQPVSRTQASDAMTSRLPRYQAKCAQCRCFQCGSVPLHSDIKGTELPLPIYWYHSGWTSFSISYGWGTTRQNVSKLTGFRWGGRSLGANISAGKDCPPPNILIPLERQLIVLQLCRWQFLCNETLQQTFRPVLSKLSKRRQI